MSAKKKTAKIYQLKVTLKGIKPPIWRRIQVPENTSLTDLHHILQITMGWENGHLHQFLLNGSFYGIPDDRGLDSDLLSEKSKRLKQFIGEPNQKFTYEYDFGDSWEHQVVLEKILNPEPNATYPRCLDGKRNCPPEDVGGIWGYEEFLAAISDESHSEHEELLEWVGGSFDPEEFDLEGINKRLKRL